MQISDTIPGFRKNRTQELVLDAMMIALTYLFTAFINIRLPIAANGGLIHLGNVPLFLAAFLFGPRCGALAGAFGMGLFDLLSGWYLWSPFTFIICGLMGWTIGRICEKHSGFLWNFLSISAACVIKLAGYYLAEGLIYGNWQAPAASIPGNLIQIWSAAVLVLPVTERLRHFIQRRLQHV